MASRFRNELTAVPPIRIQVSRRGISTTIDWTGNAASRSWSVQAPGLRSVGDARFSGPLPTDRFLIAGTRRDFGGGDVSAMTSSGLADFKDLLVATRDREREIKEDMRRARRQLMWSSVARGLAILTFASTLSKPVRDKTSNALALRRSDLATLEGNLKASTISISFDMETDIAAPHSEMISAFEQLRVSQRSWSVETSQHIDRVKARSVAGIVISRVSTILQRRADPLISTDDLPLAVDIQRGKSTAFFYPGFLLIVEKATREFGVIDIKDVELVHGSTRFTETERVPSDATMVGRAWAKSNKDGSRDRRFRDNRELPVMLYGEMSMQAVGGLNETMMFSDHDACQRFTAAVSYLKRVLAAQTGRRGVGAGRKAIPRTHQP